MAITNAELAATMKEYVRATEAHTAAFIKATSEQNTAFTTAIDRLIENDNKHHDAFRSRMGDLTLAQAVIRVDCLRNSEFREKIAKYLVAVVLIPVGAAIISFVLK